MTSPQHDYLIGQRGDNDVAVIIRQWIPEPTATEYFQWYQSNIAWTRSKVFVHGKEHDSPRLTAFVGDDAVPYYRYSNKDHLVGPWDALSVQLRDKLMAETGIKLNSALLNYYRNGDDYIAYHSDKPTEAPGNMIVGVSFGGTRNFYFKSKETGEVIKSVVRSGDCLVMYGNIQDKYQHSVPKQKGVAPRISVTLRRLKETAPQ